MKNIQSKKYTQAMKITTDNTDTLHQQGGVYYTLNQKQAKQMGFIRIQAFRKNKQSNNGQRIYFYTRNVENAKKLLNYWGARNPSTYEYSISGYKPLTQSQNPVQDQLSQSFGQ